MQSLALPAALPVALSLSGPPAAPAYAMLAPAFPGPAASRGGQALPRVDFDGEALVSRKLANVPRLRDLALQLLRRQDAPPHLKRMLVKALAQDIDVRDLTPEVRRSFKLRDSSLGCMHRPEEEAPLRQFSTMSAQTINQEAGSAFNAALATRRYTVLIANGEERPDEIDSFLVLIHELAHVRFQVFLERNIERLARRWRASLSRLSPDLEDNLIRRAEDGVWEIEAHFEVLLTERYAFQAHHELQMALLGRLYQGSTYFPLSWDRESYRSKIAARILSKYTVTHPLVRAAAQKPLALMLLGRLPAPTRRDLNLDRNSENPLVARDTKEFLRRHPRLKRAAR